MKICFHKWQVVAVEKNFSTAKHPSWKGGNVNVGVEFLRCQHCGERKWSTINKIDKHISASMEENAEIMYVLNGWTVHGLLRENATVYANKYLFMLDALSVILDDKESIAAIETLQKKLT